MKPFLPIMFEFYAIAGRRQDVREFLLDAFAEYRAVLATMIQQGIQQGEFRAVDANGVAVTYMALFEGLVLFWGGRPTKDRLAGAGRKRLSSNCMGIQVTST